MAVVSKSVSKIGFRTAIQSLFVLNERCSGRLCGHVAVLPRCEVTHSNGMMGRTGLWAWNGAWNGAPDNPSVVSVINANLRAIWAASGHGCMRPDFL
jgi:hypothetical protein